VNVFVYFAAFADEPAYERHRHELADNTRWDELEQELSRRLTSDPESRTLQPTARSLMRGAA
jgi:NIPSNAP